MLAGRKQVLLSGYPIVRKDGRRGPRRAPLRMTGCYFDSGNRTKRIYFGQILEVIPREPLYDSHFRVCCCCCVDDVVV
jgi:hypothetical protein